MPCPVVLYYAHELKSALRHNRILNDDLLGEVEEIIGAFLIQEEALERPQIDVRMQRRLGFCLVYTLTLASSVLPKSLGLDKIDAEVFASFNASLKGVAQDLSLDKIVRRMVNKNDRGSSQAQQGLDEMLEKRVEACRTFLLDINRYKEGRLGAAEHLGKEFFLLVGLFNGNDKKVEVLRQLIAVGDRNG